MVKEDDEKTCDDLVGIIEYWYMEWKVKMTDVDDEEFRPTHRLGFAKEQLKDRIWRYFCPNSAKEYDQKYKNKDE